MSDHSTIEWTDTTWNPVTGCEEISPGCDRCYARRFAERWRGIAGHPFEAGFDLTLRPERLDEPLRWRKPRMVFVNSMSDLFHPQVPDTFIARVWQAMATNPQHTFQVLTKRPARMRAWLDRCGQWEGYITHNGQRPGGDDDTPDTGIIVGALPTTYTPDRGWPLPNVWLGTSVEDQHHAAARVPHLLRTPAAVRFVSAEPLLGPVDLTALPARNGAQLDALAGDVIDPRDGVVYAPAPGCLGWVIAGGESGPGARPWSP